MTEVDPEDDAIQRFVVRHFRYDSARRERRHVVVAAYDNEPEFMARIEQEQLQLDRRRASGTPVDPSEHVTGVVHDPGHSRLAANGRLVKRAFRHGVGAGPWLDDVELPRNMGVMRPSDPPDPHHVPAVKRALQTLRRVWAARS
ncbi:hypothetical protein [Nostocoides sp. HKS02]|uniref:hypothetical protein n=1 Tax=Nostocoides sp. HKS02 TaxID=1813880 RepID=UPI0012B4E44B|nr:hypothetical protein [Tetrasphaera sp. HKS02]QGN58446.1 hypothetical protein GKE56_11760 [Tetrasphaera sp. HKS02]